MAKATTSGVPVSRVLENSLAAAAGMQAGDVIVAIDGHPVRDAIDYQYYLAEPEVTLTVRKTEGAVQRVRLVNNYAADVGLVLATDTFDGIRRCRNQCIFCFVDQQPPGLRPSLTVRDDDYRYSFLHGNYLSLTNLRAGDWERIIRWRLSPLYVSVHTTNPALRWQMMGNRRAAGIMEDLHRLVNHGITVHAQIVLCPHVNDGPELDRTLGDLMDLYPRLASVAVVPVGLTRYREHLTPLVPFDAARAASLLDQVHQWQQQCLARLGSRFVFAADEFYVLADQDFPASAAYEDFPQLENGIGMARRFIDAFLSALQHQRRRTAPRRPCLVVTGKAAGKFLPRLVEAGEARLGPARVQVAVLENIFWGPGVTAAGLLTATDLRKQLPRHLAAVGPEPPVVLLPASCLRDELFLDGTSRAALSRELRISIVPLPAAGDRLVEFLGGEGDPWQE